MRGILLILFFLAIPALSFGQCRQDLIIQQLVNKELNDTVWLPRVNEMIALLKKSKGDPLFVFPYCKPDSVVLRTLNFPLSAFESTHYPDSTELQIEHTTDRSILDDKIVYRLLAFVNDPRNFSWEICATSVPEYAILFYAGGTVTAKLFLSCDQTQLITYPGNILCRFGKLTTDQKEALKDLLLN